MLNSVLFTIEKYGMLTQGDRVVVGVSGGPDSIALLHILHSLKKRYNLYIHVSHLNHMLRGSESDEDTVYVNDFCRRLDIKCTVKYVDINGMSKAEGLSSEEAGRKARYELFLDTAREIGASKIALAHNMNDQAETVLMRAMRGTGLDGLCGIKPIREGLYIRPLLFTLRSEIEKYCETNNLKPRIDSTNLKPIYSRNKIRLQLIPYIRENYNPNFENSLSSMTELLREDNDFLEHHVEDLYNNIAINISNGISIDTNVIKNFHNAIKRRIIRKAIECVKGNLISIERLHIELILSIIDNGTTGSAVELPGNIRAQISYKHLNIMKLSGETNDKFHHLVNIPGTTVIHENVGMLESEVIEGKNVDYYIDNKFIKYFDYDRIKGTLVIRSREEGDYIVPIGMRGRKKLKELLIDSKVPREERDSIPLVAVDNEILWVVGYKINENYKITKDTSKVLRLQFKVPGGNSNAE